jgi:hypothetical protein
MVRLLARPPRLYMSTWLLSTSEGTNLVLLRYPDPEGGALAGIWPLKPCWGSSGPNVAAMARMRPLKHGHHFGLKNGSDSYGADLARLEPFWPGRDEVALDQKGGCSGPDRPALTQIDQLWLRWTSSGSDGPALAQVNQL